MLRGDWQGELESHFKLQTFSMCTQKDLSWLPRFHYMEKGSRERILVSCNNVCVGFFFLQKGLAGRLYTADTEYDIH